MTVYRVTFAYFETLSVNINNIKCLFATTLCFVDIFADVQVMSHFSCCLAMFKEQNIV